MESPRTISGSAMQIDTWHRGAMNLTGSPFVPGPHPRNAEAPTAGPDAIYSGLLECPLTTRVQVPPDAPVPSRVLPLRNTCSHCNLSM